MIFLAARCIGCYLTCCAFFIYTKIFVGTGYYVIYALFNDASNISRNLKSVSHFLMFGGTLFAPYVFNKISSIGK